MGVAVGKVRLGERNSVIRLTVQLSLSFLVYKSGLISPWCVINRVSHS